MKKFFIISCAFLMGMSLSLAQTTVPADNTSAPVKVTTNTALENIEIRIDRRLINFNRYIAAEDMLGIKSLVSSENKDFYANFLKYIETAPLFTIKRDTAQGIVKTPLDEYSFPAVMSLGGKDAKISMKFIEEDSETGNKWVIVDSNLHIIWKSLSSSAAPKKPVPPPAKWSLGSNALNKESPVTTPPVPKPEDPLNTPTTPGEKGAVTPTTNAAPIASTAVPAKPAPIKAPALIRPTSKAGLWTGGIIGIAVWITLLLWVLGGVFYFMRKRKGLKKTFLAAQAVSVASVATAVNDISSVPGEDFPIATPPASEVPPVQALPPEMISSQPALEQMESNVSLVGEAPSSLGTQADSVSSTQNTEDVALPVQETSSPETPPVPQNDIQDSTAQNIPEQVSSSETTHTPAVATSSETFEEKVSDAPQGDISLLSGSSSTEETPLTQAPEASWGNVITTPSITRSTPSEILPEQPVVMDPIFSAASEVSEVSSEQSLVMDPIFSSTGQPAPEAQLDPLFENILSPKPEPSTASSLFGGMV